MKAILHRFKSRRFLVLAVPLALCLTLLFPAIASAHAILVRSDPAKDSVLSIAPKQVRMWFSEALNPAFSTAVVVNGENKQVDNRNAHVSSSDQTEMDVSLQPNLPPAVYIVIWRTDSAADGHILRGSFIFQYSQCRWHRAYTRSWRKSWRKCTGRRKPDRTLYRTIGWPNSL